MAKVYPEIEKRTIKEIEKEIVSRIPFYTPEWKVQKNEPGYALLKIFCRMLDTINHQLNLVIEKAFTAFLDAIGITLIPPKPAKALLVFTLSKGAGKHVMIPADTGASAGDILFLTGKNIYATPSRLT